MVAAEAAAAGAAIVLTDRCGVAECFAGRGALVVPYDEAKLRDALARLLGDPELRSRLGEEAREVARGVVVAARRSSSRRTSTAERSTLFSNMRDLAIVAPDPGFGGGGRALTEALWRAAEEVGREPQLHFLRNPRLPGADGRSRLHAIASRPRVASAARPRGVQAVARRAAGRRPAAPREDLLRVCAGGLVRLRRGALAPPVRLLGGDDRRRGVGGAARRRRRSSADGARCRRAHVAPARARDAAPRARAVGDLDRVAAFARRACGRARGADPGRARSRSTPSASRRSRTTSGSAGSTRRGSSSWGARPIRARTSRFCSTPSCGCANVCRTRG